MSHSPILLIFLAVRFAPVPEHEEKVSGTGNGTEKTSEKGTYSFHSLGPLQ